MLFTAKGDMTGLKSFLSVSETSYSFEEPKGPEEELLMKASSPVL